MKKNIEEVLDGCLAEMRAGATLETVLSAQPEFAADLRPLLEVAAGLAHLPAQV